MSGVARTVGQVAGIVATVAAFIPGGQPIAAAASAVAAVSSVVATVTQKKPPVRGSATDILIGANLPTPYAMGLTYTGGTVVHDVGYGGEVSGVKNPYRAMVTVWSLGPIESVEAFQADFETVPFTGAAATGYYASFLYRSTQLGAQPEAAALAGPWGAIPKWGAPYKLSGKAACLTSLRFDKKGKIYASGVPQFGALLKGVRAYDMRKDSTYPGGSGPHRWDDESTWEWTENPALHAVTYARGRWQNGRKVFGCGFPRDGIDLAPFVAWANVCDANGWKVGGVIYEPGSRFDNLKRICEAGAAMPVFVGARLSVRYSAPKVSLYTIHADDLADGDCDVPAMRTWRDRKNILIPRYRSPDHRWEMVQADAVVAATYVAEDGEEKEDEYPIELVQDVDQATVLTAYQLVNAREFGPVVLPLKPHMGEFHIGEALLGGDDLDDDLGIAGQLLEITGRRVDPQTGIVTLTLCSETTAKHAFALGQTGSAPATPSIATGQTLDEVAEATAYRSTPHVVDSEAEMVALVAAEGEVAIRTDLQTTFIHNGGTTGTAADWTEALSPVGTTYTDEQAQDAVGTILADTATIDFTYNDAAPSITADVKADSIGNTLLANMVQATFKGRAAGAGTGDPTDLTGTQATAILDLATVALKGLMSPADFAKLAGIAAGATVNSSDATLLARANHTGTQTAATISDFNTAADARITAALGVTVQAYDADLAAIAALTTTAYGRGTNTLADAAAFRTYGGLVIGTDVQAYHARLGGIAGLTITTADNILVHGASNSVAAYQLGATGKTLMAAASQAAAQSTLGLTPGTNVQAQDARLQAIAGLTLAADKMIYWTGATSAAATDLTSVARTLLAQTTQALMRTTGLGLGTAATANTGTSGATVPLLSTSNTWSLDQIFSGNVTMGGSTANSHVINGPFISNTGATPFEIHAATGNQIKMKLTQTVGGVKSTVGWLAADATYLFGICDVGGTLRWGWNATGQFLNNLQVVGARKTGWGTATGTATRTTFDTATVTLPQLAERVKALIDDLHATAGHGLLGS